MSVSLKRDLKTPQALPVVDGGPWGTARAQEYCIMLAETSQERFPIASRFTPKHLRPHVATLYAFVRGAKDFADAPEWEGRREALLDAWQEGLRQCFLGEADHPIFVALRATVREFDLSITAFGDIIAGSRLDLSVRRYPTFAALLRYCEKSASPIGRITMGLVGDNEAEHLRAADDFMIGIRLLGMCLDIGPDFSRRRVYLPEEDMLRFGVAEADLRQRRVTKQFKALMAFEVARTRSYFLRGQPLVDFMPREARTEVQLVMAACGVALDAIERAGFDVYSPRSHMHATDWVRTGLRLARLRIANLTQW